MHLTCVTQVNDASEREYYFTVELLLKSRANLSPQSFDLITDHKNILSMKSQTRYQYAPTQLTDTFSHL